jgi:hypothetical protein
MQTNENITKTAPRFRRVKSKRNGMETMVKIRPRFVRDLALLDAALKVWDAKQKRGVV